jgi:aminopeptidase N
MENKGLNIFNTSCVLAAPDMATDLAYQRVESVVAHEYFHNWSGNRVTCRDWFQLSLKEGFTVFRDSEFSSDMNSRTVKRIEDVNFLRSVQFAEDASPLSHPIRPDSYMEISNFYTPTVYEKGAEVIRMLHTILGPEAFRRGSDLYFERHDGEAATTDDFVAAMAEASGRDLELFKRWYSQAGTPELSVRSRWEDGRLRLSFAQTCAPTPGQPVKAPLQVPIAMGLLERDGTPVALDQLQLDSDMAYDLRGDTLTLELKTAEAALAVDGLSEEPEVSLLRGFSAPVRVDFPRAESSLAVLAVHDPDGFAAWDALQTLLVREVGAYPEQGEISSNVVELYGTLLDQALDAIGADSDEVRFMLAAKLSVPDEGYLFEHFATVDVDAVITARDTLRQVLATRLEARWQSLYEAAAPEGVYAPDPRGMSRRALRNLALTYLAEAAGTEPALVERHYREADNLTERRAALVAAANVEALADLARPLLDDFYERFSHEALAVNQWFSIQATSRLADAGTVRALTDSSAFDLRNPNKVRSVYGAFAQANLRNFHASDGSGYRLIGEAVRTLNGANPQIASALAKPLTRWRRFAGRRPALMRAVLEDLAREENLSRDVFEVVSKGLADD